MKKVFKCHIHDCDFVESDVNWSGVRGRSGGTVGLCPICHREAVAKIKLIKYLRRHRMGGSQASRVAER